MGGLLRELHSWNTARQKLPENPLHELLRRIEKNRRRTDSAVIIFALLCGLCWLWLLTLILGNASVFLEAVRPVNWSHLLQDIGYGLGPLLLIPAVPAMLWLAYVIYSSLRNCLLCLSDAREAGLPGRVEQEHLLTRLDDRELLLPMLHSSLKRFIAPVLLLNFSAACLRHHWFWYERIDASLYSYPNWSRSYDGFVAVEGQLPGYFQSDSLLFFVYNFLAGSLLGLAASLILLLMALLLGSNMRSGVQINAAASLAALLLPLAIAFSGWQCFRTFVEKGLSGSPEDLLFGSMFTGPFSLLMALGCHALFGGGCLLLLASSLQRGWLRQFLSLGLPLLALLAAGLPAVIFMFGGLGLKAQYFAAAVALQCQAAIGIFLPCCLSWLPGGLPFDENYELGGLLFPMYEWWRFPLALLFQLILISFLARYALKALRSREE